jgi:serine/threonine protein phosphatase PrpC
MLRNKPRIKRCGACSFVAMGALNYAHAFFVHSEAGHDHHNEDAVVVQAHPEDNTVLICALADGQGGQMGGARAAQVAVEKCVQLAASHSAKQLLEASTWYQIISGADDAVNDDPNAGYSTLVALCVADDSICGASCGDSAVLAVWESSHEMLSERQRKNPPIGSSAAFPVAFFATLQPNSKLLIVSDGVWKYVGWDAIIETCRAHEKQDLIDALRQLSLSQNSNQLPDDFSIVLVQNSD